MQLNSAINASNHGFTTPQQSLSQKAAASIRSIQASVQEYIDNLPRTLLVVLLTQLVGLGVKRIFNVFRKQLPCLICSFVKNNLISNILSFIFKSIIISRPSFDAPIISIITKLAFDALTSLSFLCYEDTLIAVSEWARDCSPVQSILSVIGFVDLELDSAPCLRGEGWVHSAVAGGMGALLFLAFSFTIGARVIKPLVKKAAGAVLSKSGTTRPIHG
jgi:hypothetical protein